ncbi:MAG: DNA-directed RNA polymerase subunit alpha [Candidatus Pacebacteria bacterium RIFCSPHIGHO2_01_FULL_46_16]|nr:MAG: DNA-directed RNA polymerase subunit alpha [Candidatus Pacebacteria bacterium RIFCSPHIGHO2_01_FULL_46_16]OGJ22139.1 MAG: DNA-directed RNA polymerase subunit alpha [Candidatus Pacebacteria bacterium RIFCSPHIGHO2_02_FULL_46_9]OGJ38259.1 MAG: DNA-directed RNA polymerase subunit alpha [Candidatus Pacebacteria bacterium RIFCSPLOWO2_01_FULL_47_12]
MNPMFELSEVVESDLVSAITIEPLEQGYGHTLGNAIRRVLLSSLPGAAITQLRVQGVDHQFSAIPGVTEDVLEIGLNLKLVRVKAESSGSGILRLAVKGPKVVTAKDIVCEAGFSIVNGDQHIMTLSESGTVDIEMTASTGTGYQVSDEKQSTGVGDVMLDALFSPVVSVSYRVEATRVGRRTDFDKLIITVTTDGSIAPVVAVKQAAQILSRQFTQISSPTAQVMVEPETTLSPEEAEVLRLTVEELDLPTRIANALRKGGFATVGDLVGVSKNTIAKVKNLGEKSVVVVDGALQKKGVSLSE